MAEASGVDSKGDRLLRGLSFSRLLLPALLVQNARTLRKENVFKVSGSGLACSGHSLLSGFN